MAWVRLLVVVTLGWLCAFVLGFRTEQQTTYDLYVTVGTGSDEDAKPLEGISVYLRGPESQGLLAQLVPTIKKTDQEGVVKFTVNTAGKYYISINENGYNPLSKVFVIKDRTSYEDLRLVASRARIAVTVTDAESGVRIPGASIKTMRGDQMVADHMTTDAAGEATVVINRHHPTAGGDNFAVTVSHPDFETQTGYVRSLGDEARDLKAPFALKRKPGWKALTITALEEGTRAKILGARVIVEGGGNRFYTETTGADGVAQFRVQPGTVYSVSITTTHFEPFKESVDMTGGKDVNLTCTLTRKEGDRELRRALIVTVKGRDQDGVVRPLPGATVLGPGLHDAVTDENGRIVFFHTVPPGETVTLNASAQLYKPGATTVLIRDKGVMVDLRQLSRDTRNGVSLYDAFRKQGATAYDTGLITLDWGEEKAKVVVGAIDCPAEADPDSTVRYSVRMTLNQGDEDGFAVEEVIQIFGPDGTLIKRDGNIRALNEKEETREDFAFEVTKSGKYLIKAKALWKGTALWSGEATVTVGESRKEIKLSGDVVAEKGVVKLDETVAVNVNVLYEEGPEPSIQLRETVELFDPLGKVVQNNFSQRSLTRKAYSFRKLNITCQAKGTYVLKSTIRDAEGNTLWTASTSFEVSGGGKSVMEQKPGKGYFRLVKKTVGKAASGIEDQYGTVSGSLSESSFEYNYQMKAPYEGHAKISVKFSTPPTILKPGDVLELTAEGSGDVGGKDVPYIGGGGGWNFYGEIPTEVIKLFVGRSSQGKDYASGTGKWKFIVPENYSRNIKLDTFVSPVWGNDGVFRPCLYEYEFVPGLEPPPTESTAPPKLADGGLEELPMSESDQVAGQYSDEELSVLGEGTYLPYRLILNLRPSKRENVYEFSGYAECKKDGLGAPKFTFKGSLYDRTGQLRGTGEMVPKGQDDFTVTIDGQKAVGLDVPGSITIKRDRDGKGQTIKFVLKKR